MPSLTRNMPFEFKKLPYDLRLMIWEAMFPKAQIYEVVVQCSSSWKKTFHIRPFSLPMVFQICSESRNIARERFKRFAIDMGTEVADCSVPYGYCDPNIDTLYIPFRAIGLGSKFGPFRRIIFTVDYPGRGFPTHPNIFSNVTHAPCPELVSDYTTKTSDDRLQLCFVTGWNNIKTPGHKSRDSIFPYGPPEPKPLTRAWPYYEKTKAWISFVEQCAGGGLCPIVTVGDVPTAPGIQSGARARRRSTGRRRDDEQPTMGGNVRTRTHGMVFRSCVRQDRLKRQKMS